MRTPLSGAWPGQARAMILGSRCSSTKGVACRMSSLSALDPRRRAGRALMRVPGLQAQPPSLRRFYASQTSGDAGSSPSQSSGSSSGSRSGSGPGNNGGSDEPSMFYKMLEAAATSGASIVMLGVGFGIAGYGYHRFYKHLVLAKMDRAFEPGDPVLELAALGRGVPKHIAGSAGGVIHRESPPNDDAGDVDGNGDDGKGNYWIERPEQRKVNDIIAGKEVGHYHLFIGEKGTGKSSMQMEAMALVDAEGVAMFDAHSDLEIFRIRLGKALNYEYNEDYIGGYFSEKGPRESTALLDIERALNKLEKVALRRRNTSPPSRKHRPLIMIVNQMHLIRDDEDGRDLIELLQQRAEQWAASGLVTMVFNSDDYWVYERLKQLAARLEVHSIQDLARHQAMVTLQRFRWRYFGEHLTKEQASEIYNHVGGRLTFLNRVARSGDMLATCRQIMEAEKTWFLNQCWVLGADMDDDVMDQQKWAAAAMVLAQALVDKEAEMKEDEGKTSTVSVVRDPPERTLLPSFALHEAQQIMTRADFIREMDRKNLFTIASDAQVRATSVPMQEALRQICNKPGFRQHLEDTIQRIADIESLGRTRELVAKDLILGGRYEFTSGPSLSSSASSSSSSSSSLFKKGDGAKKTEVRFRGWSPHERPSRDPPETEDGDAKE